ncbi:MAG: glycosyltransferase family 4 protein [Anaerolineaceae bacterium]|nr:glycosyltransferase family 4 protein [Anaerolineaceae bacterium]
MGYWGASVPEYLHWYRTRIDSTTHWKDLNEENLQEFQAIMRARYPALWAGNFPHPQSTVDEAFEQISEVIPISNRIFKTKPRLMIIAPWMVMGGAEKFNLDLINQLCSRGWEVTHVTTAQANHTWQSEFERITPDIFPLNTFLDWSDYPRFIAYLIRSRQVDAILITASQEAYRLLPYLRLKFPDIPIIDYVHFVTPKWMDGGFPRLSVFFQSSLDMSIVTSQQVKNWMVDAGGNKERIFVCTANVDTMKWKPDRRRRRETRDQLGIDDDFPLILYIGRIEPQKQPNVLAGTIMSLVNQGDQLLCLVIGDGTLRGWLEELVTAKKLTQAIRILGEQPLERVLDFLAAGDIIFLPSENEGISMVIYEGMACGLVPVAADVGGQSELVTPECGVLIRKGTPDEEVEHYAAALKNLIIHPEQRQEMGRACRDRVTRYFRQDQMGERMIALIEEAKNLRIAAPRDPSSAEVVGALAREVAEYSRARAEANALHARYDIYATNPPMPPVSAGTYLYFAMRKIFFPLYTKITTNGDSWLSRLKTIVKGKIMR